MLDNFTEFLILNPLVFLGPNLIANPTHRFIFISVHFLQKLAAKEHICGLFIPSLQFGIIHVLVVYIVWIFALFGLVFDENLVSLIDQLLLTLDIFEHVFGLRH